MRRFTFAVALSASSLVSISALADTVEVGPGKTYATICAGITAAKVGDTVQVDASGNYDGESCSWDTDNVTVVGVNGRPKINLTSAPSNDKGIFTITAAHATVENFEFSGATSSDSNGAGIRHQGLNLTVRGCYFHDNQDGILGAPATNQSATAADGQGTVLIETSEFASNGAGDGKSHNMYIGDYGSFTLRASYSHGAKVGQLVKSRAYKTFILYNRLTDESGTTASYEVDIPNGGTSYVIGNLIEQSMESQNDNIIETGDEGATNPTNAIYVVNNTIVNDQGKGTFLNVTSATATLANNIMIGGGTITNLATATLSNNWDATNGDPKLVDPTTYDYHLQTGSPCVDQGKDPGAGPDQSLSPIFEYVHPTNVEGRAVSGSAIDIGAYELGGGVALGDGGIDSIDAGGGGGNPNSDGGPTSLGTLPGGRVDDGGCGCVLAESESKSNEAALAIFGFAIALGLRRSRIHRK